MIPSLLQWTTILACAGIVLMGMFMAINNMGRCTRHVVRFAWILITCGAFGTIAGQLSGHPAPGIAECMGWLGISLFVAFDRRKYFVIPPNGRILRGKGSANWPQ